MNLQETQNWLNVCGWQGFARPGNGCRLAAILFGAGDRHVSAESLHQEALAARINVSLATVYNTLNQFKAAGLLREVAFEGDRTFFDTNTSNHFHYYLEDTDQLVDIGASRSRSKGPARTAARYRSRPDRHYRQAPQVEHAEGQAACDAARHKSCFPPQYGLFSGQIPSDSRKARPICPARGGREPQRKSGFARLRRPPRGTPWDFRYGPRCLNRSSPVPCGILRRVCQTRVSNSVPMKTIRTRLFGLPGRRV